MTHDQRYDQRHDHDHGDGGHDHAGHDHADHAGHAHDDYGRGDETRVVERQEYVERPAAGYVPPPAPAGGQVNVNADRRATYVDTGHSVLYYAKRVLTLLFTILAVLLAIRVILLALVANQQNDIVDFVYNVTEPFVAPFRGIFQFDEVRPGGGSVLDLAAVVAFIGWLLIYLLILAILNLADRDRV